MSTERDQGDRPELSHLQVARLQMAFGGLAIVDDHALWEALPSNWSASRDAMTGSVQLRDIVKTLMAEYLRAKWFHTKLVGRPVLGLARTLNDINRRVENLTGRTINSLEPINFPLSAVYYETDRGERVHPPAPDDLGFDLAEVLASLPHHPCANRTLTLERIERYWLKHPETYIRAGVYGPGDAERHDSIRIRLKQAHPEHDFGPDLFTPPTGLEP